MSQAETCPAELPNWCAQRHWAIFWILIVVATGLAVSRIVSLGDQARKETRPFYSANDRSRWTTVRALGDQGVFEIDSILNSKDGKQWDSIDKVRHVGRDGKFHYYSSKPPFLTTLVAGGYRILKFFTGWRIASETHLVVKTLLIFVNVLPWAFYLWLVARMVNSVPVRDWTRYFVLACACFGTYLLTYTIALNNHLPAAVAVMAALYCLSEISRRPDPPHRLFQLTGLAAALGATFELPALSFFAVAFVVCLRHSIGKTLHGFLPYGLVVLAMTLYLNFLAFGQIKSPYFQRHDGPVIAEVSGNHEPSLNDGTLPDPIYEAARKQVQFADPFVERGQWPGQSPSIDRWVVRDLDPTSTSQMVIIRRPEQPEQYEIREWGNWYDYPGSYWSISNPKRSFIDQGQTSQLLYAFHLLFGHHGVFSLTPIWILSFAGMFALLGGARLGGHFQMRWLGAVGLVLSVVVIAFYISRPETDRNYGGQCCVARWLLWLSPIWLASMLPVVDWLGGSRWGKWLCFILLLLSVISASIPASNPWTHPWLFNIWELTGLPM